MERIVSFIENDLISYITTKGFTINENALNIFIDGELSCYNRNIALFSSDLLLPLISRYPKFREIIDKHRGDSNGAIKFIEKTLDKARDCNDRDHYYVENYSMESWSNCRFEIINGCMKYAKENNRFIINESDIVLSILEIHDDTFPSFDNGSISDVRLHTSYNTLSHVVGYFNECLWVKNEDIKWELSNLHKKNYDVAISFAGEDRKLAEEIAENLSRLGIKVFYDNFERANLWGKDLYAYLSEVYGKKAKYCLMVISENYAKKHWTNLERQAAQAKAFREKHEYILPLRLDDTEIPGILPTTGYIDIRNTSINEIVNLIIEKISQVSNAK